MKSNLAFLLSLLLGTGSALAQSGQTINQLSPGAALAGNEQIPMYQGSNPAVTTTPAAIATFIAGSTTINVKNAPFSAICDGGSHLLSGRFGTLAAAQAVYPFITSLSQETDYAALKLASNTAFGADGTEHGTSNPQANISLYIPQGVCYLGNDTWTIRNLEGARIEGAGTMATKIEGNRRVLAFDGLWYSWVGNFSVETLSSSATVALDIDGNTGTAGYTTFGVQADTFPNLFVYGGGSTYALALCRQGASAGQCSELTFINLHASGASEAVYFQNGFNAIDNVLVGGDMQDYPKNAIELIAGSVKVLGMSFESTNGYTQITNGGCDIQASAGGAEEAILVYGSRSESLCVYNGAWSQWADIRGLNHRPAAAGNWQAQHVYPSNIGVDGTNSSGNVYFFLPTSIVPESVTGHFASSSWAGTAPSGFGQIAGETWNNLASDITLTNSNLTATQNADDQSYSPGYGGLGESSGRYYWEINADISSGGASMLGIGNTSSSTAIGQWLGIGADTMGYSPNGQIYNNGALVTTLAPYAYGAAVGFALDLTHNKLWVRSSPSANWNNDILANQNPATNTGGLMIPAGVLAHAVVPAFNTYLFTTGASGLTQPAWPSTGTVTDGSITWTMTPYTAVSIAEGSLDTRTSHIDGAASIVEGSVPSVSGCGSSPSLDNNSTRYSGTLTEGSGAAGCAITLNFWLSTTAPRCVVSSPSGATLTSYGLTQNMSGQWVLAIVNPLSAVGGNQFTWICQQ